MFAPEHFIYIHGIFGSADPHLYEPSKPCLTQPLLVSAPPTTSNRSDTVAESFSLLATSEHMKLSEAALFGCVFY